MSFVEKKAVTSEEVIREMIIDLIVEKNHALMKIEKAKKILAGGDSLKEREALKVLNE